MKKDKYSHYSPRIVIVDDDENDVEVLCRAFKRLDSDCEIRHISNGNEFLEAWDEFSGAVELPDLVLLDLNMPGMDGRETLSRLKGDDQFQTIPVVVLSSSKAQRDVVAAYKLGANSYISKPTTLAGFHKAAQIIDEYWLRLVRLPSGT